MNFNQMTRWVNTKEEHASKIIDVSLQRILTSTYLHALACWPYAVTTLVRSLSVLTAYARYPCISACMHLCIPAG